MHILYLTPPWKGFNEMLFDGALASTGMPAFIKPLQHLIKQGHTIDFAILCDEKKQNFHIKADWLKNSQFFPVYYKTNGMHRILSAFRVFFHVKKLIASNQYDFIYGQGPIGAISSYLANKHNLPSGQRLYGTFLYPETQKFPAWKIFLKHPLEYLSYKIKKNFLLITNDGTKGDLVQQHLNPNPSYDVHFLLNGVDHQEIPQSEDTETAHPFKEPFLFYPCRIAHWKRQDRVVDILAHLHQQGKNAIHLYLAGHITDQDYWQKIQQQIAKNKLQDFVHYLGPLNKPELWYGYQHCLALLSFYDYSNLGNVVLEAMAAGAVIIAQNDGTLDQLIVPGETGFLANTPEEAGENIMALLQDQELRKTVQKKVRQSAQEKILTWEVRSQQECKLIEQASKVKPS